MTDAPPDTDALLAGVAAGDPHARDRLLARHRTRLRRMVDLRLDPRLAGRADPSDVVQEVLAAAAPRLNEYARERPIPFYPWLRQFAADRLADLHRRHRHAARRSVAREHIDGLPDGSALALAGRLADTAPGPSERARRAERRERVRDALLLLPPADREALALRFLEELTAGEVAVVLNITEAAAKKRVLRALARLQPLLADDTGGGE
jgi:RNA polymerase sigma-70 factor (ECF subfamily)